MLRSIAKIILKLIFIICKSKYFAEKAITLADKISRYLDNILGIGSSGNCDNSGEHFFIQKIPSIFSDNIKDITVFDVGANIGRYAKKLLDINITASNIHCFEPAHSTYQLLKTNLADTNVTINNFALGYLAEKKELYYDITGSGLASFTKRRLDHFQIDMNKHETVDVKTLDEYCKTNAINHIHFLKLDVEGHELDILRGG